MSEIKITYDSGVIKVELKDHDNGCQVTFQKTLEQAAWPNGYALDLSDYIHEIIWKKS